MQDRIAVMSRSPAIAAAIGAFLGGGLWAALAFGLGRSCDPQTWIGHVFSSSINAGSFIAFGAAVAELLQRLLRQRAEAAGMAIAILGDDTETLLLPDDVRTARKQLHAIPADLRESIPMRLLTTGLLRARANWSATDVSSAIEVEANLIQEEVAASYSNIRYLAWAIPSIGFIGTVLGIGWAMSDMNATGDEALNSATASLSVAFDTTFVALTLSLVLMFLLHQVEAGDDRLLTQAKSWCMRCLPLRMHISQDRECRMA